MAKKNRNKMTNLILMAVSLATAALSFVGLALNFITGTSKIGSVSSTVDWNLSDWFGMIDDMADYDKIGSWQTARVMLFATLVLLGIMALLLIAKCFVKRPLLKWSLFGTALAVFACALIFMITVCVGCGALTNDSLITTFTASFGVYLLTIGAMISSACAAVTALRK